MARRELKKLSARSVVTIGRPGRHSDGGGLYLVVDASGAKRWLFMYRQAGKLREMGLGGLNVVSLAEARDAADIARKIVRDGRDPIAERRAAKAAEAATVTFWPFAQQLIKDIEGGFRNAKHRAQWSSTLSMYAGALHDKRLDEIGTDDVLAVLQPIWTTKAETASRVRGRIERVLDAAKVKGLRSGENPARWRGHLDHLLSKRQKLTRGHHAAMPYRDVPAFIARLRERPAVAASALEFLILCASRTGEAIGARWSEIDLDAKTWTIPAARMKAAREHRVALSARAVDILNAMRPASGASAFVFPGRPGKPLSGMAMEMLLRRMDVDVTVHGFRSSFRDWVDEATAFPGDLAELALAHVVGDDTERAYRRGDGLEKRRKVMQAWSDYIARGRSKNSGTVVEMRRA